MHCIYSSLGLLPIYVALYWMHTYIYYLRPNQMIILLVSLVRCVAFPSIYSPRLPFGDGNKAIQGPSAFDVVALLSRVYFQLEPLPL